jgi:bZIP transcription factor
MEYLNDLFGPDDQMSDDGAKRQRMPYENENDAFVSSTQTTPPPPLMSSVMCWDDGTTFNVPSVGHSSPKSPAGSPPPPPMLGDSDPELNSVFDDIIGSAGFGDMSPSSGMFAHGSSSSDSGVVESSNDSQLFAIDLEPPASVPFFEATVKKEPENSGAAVVSAPPLPLPPMRKRGRPQKKKLCTDGVQQSADAAALSSSAPVMPQIPSAPSSSSSPPPPPSMTDDDCDSNGEVLYVPRKLPGELTRFDFLKMTSVGVDEYVRWLETNRVQVSASEENMLKRQRKLIKNRESAQLSRMRKKLYVQDLEHRVNQLSAENNELVMANAQLVSDNAQLKKRLQSIERQMHAGRAPSGSVAQRNKKIAGVCVLAVLFSFGLFMGSMQAKTAGGQVAMPPLLAGASSPLSSSAALTVESATALTAQWVSSGRTLKSIGADDLGRQDEQELYVVDGIQQQQRRQQQRHQGALVPLSPFRGALVETSADDDDKRRESVVDILTVSDDETEDDEYDYDDDATEEDEYDDVDQQWRHNNSGDSDRVRRRRRHAAAERYRNPLLVKQHTSSRIRSRSSSTIAIVDDNDASLDLYTASDGEKTPSPLIYCADAQRMVPMSKKGTTTTTTTATATTTDGHEPPSKIDDAAVNKNLISLLMPSEALNGTYVHMLPEAEASSLLQVTCQIVDISLYPMHARGANFELVGSSQHLFNGSPALVSS